MKLNNIELLNFRSYQQQCFDFESGGNLIIGANGSGKTNLLEAIAYTSIVKSIRYLQDQDLVFNTAEHFAINALYETDLSVPKKLHLSYANSRKILKINGEVKRQLSAIFSEVKVIYCAPDDIGLINGSPRMRRQYFDLAISQLFPAYIGILRDYLHVVDQRNQLLKIEYSPSEKKSWDARFAQSLCALYPYRKKYLQLLNQELCGAYKEISENTRNLKINYVPVLRNAFGLMPEIIEQHLQTLEPREKQCQRCLVGAHLDDYSFRIEDFGMRARASQGQKRIAVIILKMILAQLIESNTGIRPVILFDDVFAELDYVHGEKIKALCNNNYQIFVASPKEDVRQIFGNLQVIRLGSGL